MKMPMMTAAFLAICLVSVGLRAEIESSFYVLAGLDGKILTNQDANSYYNVDGQFKPVGLPSFMLHAGFQFERWLSLEASANLGLSRNNEYTYNNGGLGVTRHIKTRWNLATYSLTPGVTWVGKGYINMLGLRVGVANLDGHVDDDALGLSGAYDQESHVYDMGLVFRSSWIVVGHVSLGFEFGYDWTQFKDIQTKNGTGTYGSPGSPEHNVSTLGHNGDVTTLDFSGPHAGIVLGYWSNPSLSRVKDPLATPGSPASTGK